MVALALLPLAFMNGGVNVDWVALTAVGVQVLSVVTVIYILQARSTSSVHKVFSQIADVIGFWPPPYHPFRWRVLPGHGCPDDHRRDRTPSRASRARRTQPGLSAVRLGGGQAAGGLPVRTGGHKLTLVTCGSPLQTLYRTMFPGTFDDAMFANIATLANGGWLNFWRMTDPISTPVPPANPYEIPDPPHPSDPLLKHSDYWIAEEQLERIRAHLAGEA